MSKSNKSEVEKAAETFNALATGWVIGSALAIAIAIVLFGGAILGFWDAPTAKASGPTQCMIDGTCDPYDPTKPITPSPTPTIPVIDCNQYPTPVDCRDDDIPPRQPVDQFPERIPTADTTLAPAVEFQQPAALPETGIPALAYLVPMGLYGIVRKFIR